MTKIFNRTDYKITRKALRHNMPLAEVILWGRLKGKQMGGFKFRRQYGIDRFVTDFYCPALKLAIEIDGDSHFKEHSIYSDKERQARIETLGIQFVRFTNREVYENIEAVTLRIMEIIRRITTPSPPCQGGD